MISSQVKPPDVPLSLDDIRISEVTARQWCRKKSSYISQENHEGCQWYHGSWKFLKKLGMVSEPRWHLEFYLNNIYSILRDASAPSILICGAADEGMLSVVLNALSDYQSYARIVMCDLCLTPLLLSERFLKSLSLSNNYEFFFVVGHALTLPFQDNSFDIIVTDAFLTRFTKQHAQDICVEWERVLRPGGRVVTTARLWDNLRPMPELFQVSFRERIKYTFRAISRAKKEDVSTLKAARVAWGFAQKMTSHPFANIDQVVDTCNQLQISVTISDEQEEVSMRRYARIVGIKKRIAQSDKSTNTHKEKKIMPYRIVIVHGAYGNPDENWFPWLQDELEKLGQRVITPQFPTPEGQQLETWLQILDQAVGEYGSDIIFVGHSLGPALILRKLEQLDLDSPVRGAFLVSGFLGELGLPEFDEINANFFESKFDWGKIRFNCRRFFVYNSDNDPYVPLDKGRELAEKLCTDLTVIHGAGHINAAAGYTKFEKLLSDIKLLIVR